MLLLDTRPPPTVDSKPKYPDNMHDAAKHLLNIERELVAVGAMNNYEVATIAFLHTVLKEIKKKKKEDDAFMKKNKKGWRSDDQQLVPENQPLHAVITAHEDRTRKDSEMDGTLDGAEQDDDEDVMQAIAIINRLTILRRKVRAKWQMKLIDHVMSTLDDSIETEEHLNTWFVCQTVNWRFNFAQDSKMMGEIVKAHADPARRREAWYFTLSRYARSGVVQGGGQSGNSTYVLTVRPDHNDKDSARPPIPEIKSALIETLQKLKESYAQAATCDTFLDNEVKTDNMMNLRRTLKSHKLYSGNLRNPKKLAQVLNQVARINRLPDANTHEGMQVLRLAWDSIDRYTYQANRSKQIAKASYFLMLLIAALTNVVVVVSVSHACYPAVTLCFRPPRVLNIEFHDAGEQSTFTSGLFRVPR